MIIDSFLNVQQKQKTEEKSNDEKIKRSFAKTISWRIVGTADTVIISWLLTGTLTLALSIGAIELVSKMILYFFHERAWNQIKWGK
ncbi:DUF2061 domain-containing protein [Flavobacteriaceae sp. LMIT009]